MYRNSRLLERPHYLRLLKKAGLDVSLLGSFIGDGAEGEVWSWGSGQIFKIFEIDCWEEQEKIFRRLRGKHGVAKLFGYGRLNRVWGWMICERLEKMESRYERAIDRCDASEDLLRSRLKEVKQFGSWLRGMEARNGLWYWDLHGGNVMQKGGKLKICDLTGFGLSR